MSSEGFNFKLFFLFMNISEDDIYLFFFYLVSYSLTDEQRDLIKVSFIINYYTYKFLREVMQILFKTLMSFKYIIHISHIM